MDSRTGPWRYKNLAELAEAYKTGELSADDRMMLDNDCTPVYLYDHEKEDFGEKVFDSYGPSCLLEEALTLLGVPWENA